MSIQAGWNSVLYQAGMLSKLSKVSEEQKKTNKTLDDYRKIEAERAERAQLETEGLNRIAAENQDEERIRSRVQENREDMSMGIGMPEQRYGTVNQDGNIGYATEEEIAAYRAAQAAAAADSQPRNNINGAVDALRRRQNGGDN